MNTQIITPLDWLLTPFYVLIIFIFASHIKNLKIKKNPLYKYFLWGLFAKIFGAVSVCVIYVYYYKEGGDTLAYHASGKAMVNLLFYSPGHFIDILLGSTSAENHSVFNNDTGYPYFWSDKSAFNVVRFISLIELIGLKSYIVSSVLMSVLSFTGIWVMYLLFSELYPGLKKHFAFSVLFFPSLVFWGSGLLKDSWTLSAACWFCVSFYRAFIEKRNILFYVIALLVASFVMVSIKPYIFVAIVPGCLLWLIWGRISGIKNILLRILVGPLIVSFGVLIGAVIWMNVSSGLGEYSSLDSMINKAYVASDDLKKDYYQGNSFDLGYYEPTLAGVFSKFPIATITGLFRPFFWEAKNIVMLLSGFENLILLFFFIYFLLKSPIRFFSMTFSNPFVLFCLSFAIIFAFSVAISTSNFGALVRLRIPMLPFFLSGLFVVAYSASRNTIPMQGRKL